MKSTQNKRNYDFIESCKRDDLDEVKRLLASRNLSVHADIHVFGDEALISAGKHLHIIKYLLTSPELTDHVNIHAQEDYALVSACRDGQLDIVRYLLTSSELSEHSDIHSSKELPLQMACQYGHLEVVKYLLTSPELSDHAHLVNDLAFVRACENDHFDVVTYLIFEHNVQLTNLISSSLTKNNLSNILEQFKIRDEKTMLSKVIVADSNNKKTWKL